MSAQTICETKDSSAPASKCRRPQARSLERRKKILDAARALLASEPISNLSLYDVAKQAEIPPSSLYHFFPKIEVLLQSLAEEVFKVFDECIAEPIPARQVQHWSDISCVLESRMQAYYQQNPVARALILGQHLHSDILTADHTHDQIMGKNIETIYNQFFEMPKLPETYNIFTIALQISDKVYAMSHQEHGNITPTYAQEGWHAAKAYLGLYLPDKLPRKKLITCDE